MIPFDPIFSVSGFAVGMIVGMTGVGGGALMTPLLVLLFGIAPATAVGTDLLYAAATKTGGTVVHARHGHVEWRIVGLLAAGSLPGALATLWGLRALEVDHALFSRVITRGLGCALLLTAFAILARPWLQRIGQHRAGAWRQRQISWLTVAVGLALGLLVTVSSVGAGALGVTALLVLYPRLATARIVGTDIAHAVPLTLVAGLGHASMGTVNWALLGSLLVGSLPGIWLGSTLSARVPEGMLRAGLASVLVIVGGKLAF